MVTRRQTLKVVISSLLVPAFEMSPFAKAAGLRQSSRVTDPACGTCSNSEELKNIYAHALDSAPLLKHASLPRFLHPIKRSMRSGAPLQYVESATGSLTFAINDLKLNGLPAVMFSRFYNSSSTLDNGLGRGWSINLDDRIAIRGATAIFYAASGDVVELSANADQSIYAARNPGLSVHKSIARTDANTLIERVSADISRIYRRSGDFYYLSAIDYGARGAVSINRNMLGKIVSIANESSGYRIDLAWSEPGRLVALSDSASRSVQFSYSGDLLTSHRDVIGANWQYQYADGQLSSVIDPMGTAILAADYTDNRVVQTETIAGLLRYSYGLTSSGVVDTVTTADPNGRSWTYSHNANGQVIAVRSSGTARGEVALAYDDAGNLASTTSASGTHKYAYDNAGRLTLSAKGKNWKQWQYQSDGRLQSVTDAAGPTSFEYDTNGGLIKAVSPKKIRSHSTSSIGGRLATLQSTRRSLSFSYTPQGQLSAVVDAKRGVLQYGYDAHGLLISERLAGSYSANARRNARGELTDWSDSTGRQFTFQRDTRGALVQITNTTGEWARAERDSSGRVVRLSNSQGQSRTFGYDRTGALANYMDALNRSYVVEYDAASGKAVRMTQSNGATVIVRGSNGDAILQSTASATDAVPQQANLHALSDGWQNPLYGNGLLGSFSGFTQYAANAVASTLGGSVPAALAALMVGGTSATNGNGGDGDEGDDDGDDDDDDDDDDSPNPDCQPCESAYQSTCTSTQSDDYNSAQWVEIAADALCALTIETGPGMLLCLAAAEAIYQAQIRTADTKYNNCVTLIPQNCYSQCQ